VNDPHSGDHSGSGFVMFDSTESATAAMQALNGTETANGEKIILDFAIKERPRGSGSRRFRRQKKVDVNP
jgi:hypothetical protein